MTKEQARARLERLNAYKCIGFPDGHARFIVDALEALGVVKFDVVDFDRIKVLDEDPKR